MRCTSKSYFGYSKSFQFYGKFYNEIHCSIFFCISFLKSTSTFFLNSITLDKVIAGNLHSSHKENLCQTWSFAMKHIIRKTGTWTRKHHTYLLWPWPYSCDFGSTKRKIWTQYDVVQIEHTENIFGTRKSNENL